MRNVMCIAVLAILVAAGGLFADTAAAVAPQAGGAGPVLPSVLSFSLLGGASVPVFSPSISSPGYAEFLNFGLTLPGILPRSERFAFSVEGAAVFSLSQSNAPVSPTGGHGVDVVSGMLGAGATWYATRWLTLSADVLSGYYYTYEPAGAYSGLGVAVTTEADLNFLLFNFPLYVGLSASMLDLVGFSNSLVVGLVLGSRAIFGPRPVLDADPSQPSPVKDWILPLQRADPPADASAPTVSYWSVQGLIAGGFTVVQFSDSPTSRVNDNFSIDFRLPFWPIAFLRADFGLRAMLSSMMRYFTGFELGLAWRFIPSMELSLRAGPIYNFYQSMDRAGTGDFYGLIGLGLSYYITPAFSVGIDLSLNGSVMQYVELSGGLMLSYHFQQKAARTAVPALPQPAPEVTPEKPQLLQTPSKDELPAAAQIPPKQEPSAAVAASNQAQKPAAPSGNGLAIQDFSVDGIFPIFHTYYDDHPIGRLTLTNTEYSAITNVTVSFIIRQYMDAPKECVTLTELKPGEQKKVDIYALFKNTLLDITQATKVAGEITVSYSLNGKPVTLSKVETIRIYDRNAMTWDDDRKAAAFVTPKEPAVLIFSNNINALLKGKLNRAIDKNLQVAIALHDALRLFGISYVSNPLTPYAVTSRDKSVVDTLKFPRQTFDYRSGDCSDLSILYSALMESVQIETAFITIPGHIFMAFALRDTPEEIRRTFTQTDELIFRNDKVWVPVEVTERDKSFMGAWQEGAKEWRDNLSKGQAGFYPVREAWSIYEPVGLPGSGAAPALPDAAQLVKDFRGDVTALVDREIFTKVAELQAAIAKSQESPKSVNVLGVLYARYDLLEKAEREFKKAIAKAEFSPALLNLGNLSYRNGDMEGALAFYTRANKKDPKNPLALLGIARASHEIENYATVKKAFAELKALDPNLASRFAYLELKGEEATRAAEISEVKELVIWQE